MASISPQSATLSTTKVTISPPTVEEEDAIIHSRITNDERALRRVIKKFNGYSAVAHAPIAPSTPTESPATAIGDAREAFLIELASFSLQLKKAVMVCEAEARQVEEYKRERQRIELEHGSLKGHIEQLKTSLEHAQLERKQKIEYDVFAEKINTLPNRQELEQSIQLLENDMAAIRAEHDSQDRLIMTQKSSLFSIISDLGALRLMGKETETPHEATPAPDATMSDIDASQSSTTVIIVEAGDEKDDEVEEGEEAEDIHESSDDVPLSASLNPKAKPFTPTSTSRNSMPSVPTLRSLRSTSRPTTSTPASVASLSRTASKAAEPEPEDDDIEMGELAEEPKDVRGKKKVREEELEEGEASDMSSELSDPPDD
ncbi:hypothetical protein BV25DRAFT_1821609 [Artomyces pyxidatus]|uniref:Uncharacterized protein n=1 Tax=Artomyces pyxidatus TaxID=48021 RepID=A0ACB8TCG5_9AGAM|nr:hypothetical protein BV25DRAFT_1821609 [Artomyces pyxidatus]